VFKLVANPPRDTSSTIQITTRTNIDNHSWGRESE
jgi:hypothetical protein